MRNLDKLIARRRRFLNDPSLPPDATEKWGLALSGGGIRSATFALGLITSLARKKLLLRFDFMSTVSGGGYTGATVGRLFDRARTAEEARAVQDGLAMDEANWTTWWLRANGRYLIPSGVLDMTFIVALYVRNLLATHFELGLLAVIAACLMAMVDIVLWGVLAWGGFVADPRPYFGSIRWLSPYLPVAWVLLLPPLVLVGAIQIAAFWCLPWVGRVGRFTRLYFLVLLSFLALLWLFNVFGNPGGEIGADLRFWLWVGILALVAIWLAAAQYAYLPGSGAVRKRASQPPREAAS